jgi:hypothetical protein
MSMPEGDPICKRGRELLPGRRPSTTRTYEHKGAHFTMTDSTYPDDRIGEVFLNAARANSTLDAIISDAAIAISLALQFGCPLEQIRRALKRDIRGTASSPIGAALDLLP